jgi:hypothetical protein
MLYVDFWSMVAFATEVNLDLEDDMAGLDFEAATMELGDDMVAIDSVG